MKKTIVLGASTNPGRYSYLAIKMLREYGHPVIAMGSKEGIVEDVAIQTECPMIAEVDTLTLYLNPERQRQFYSYVLSIRPRRIIMNPGTENEELIKLARAHGIDVVEACTLVMLRSGQFEA
jgi:predicted CoA-binding protein